MGNIKIGFIIALIEAKKIAKITGEKQMIYAYNSNSEDLKGHHIIIEKSIDDCFKDDDKLDFVKEVIPE